MKNEAALRRDLAAVRRWIETTTYCAIQSREGWYVKDCIESKMRQKCERCKMLARLDKHLAADGTKKTWSRSAERGPGSSVRSGVFYPAT